MIAKNKGALQLFDVVIPNTPIALLTDIVDKPVGEYIVNKLNSGVSLADKKIIGIAFSDTATISYTWYQSLWEGVKMTGQLLWAIVYAFYDLIRNLIIGQGATVEVAGPIGIADLTGQMVHMGFIYLLQFTALLSLNLAIINILPFPALDGGRLLFLVIRLFTGGRLTDEMEGRIHFAGIFLLFALMIYVTWNDIGRYILGNLS